MRLRAQRLEVAVLPGGHAAAGEPPRHPDVDLAGTQRLQHVAPHLLAGEDRARAQRLAPAVRDPSEFLWAMREEPRFVSAFKSAPPGGKVAYHAPCHLRAQGIGFKGRDLLRRIPGVTVAATVVECCGHDGTYAMTVEGFGPSQKIGQKAFAGMQAAGARVWATDCPLAALQFQQHAGTKPLHPLAILARATRPDGFADLEEKA